MHKITFRNSKLYGDAAARLIERRKYIRGLKAAIPAVHICQSSTRTPAIPSLSSFADFRVWGMPVEERRKPIHGGLAAAPCCRHPRQAHPPPFLISKLGIAARTPFRHLKKLFHARFLVFFVSVQLSMPIVLSACQFGRPGATIHGALGDPCAMMAARDCLRSLMRSMSHEVYDQKLNALEVEDERRRQALQMADRIKSVSRYIQDLPGKDNYLELDDDEKAFFSMLAVRLGEQAEEIRRLAKAYRIRALNASLDRVAETCNECHSRFQVH